MGYDELPTLMLRVWYQEKRVFMRNEPNPQGTTPK